MSFLEKDLETIIFEAMQTDEGQTLLYERGLHLETAPFHAYFRSERQLKIGDYGICDIITISRQDSGILHNILHQPMFYIEIIEIKKDEVNLDTMIQVCRYARGVERYMKLFHPKLRFKIFTTMIGSSINKSEWVYLSERDKTSRILTYKYGIDGVQFTVQKDFFKPTETWEKKRALEIK